MRDEVPAFDKNLIEAEENFVIDAQFLIQGLLDQRGMSRAELARKIGVSKARLTQMMRPDANPTLRTVARVLHALGEKAQLSSGRAPSSGEASASASADAGLPKTIAWLEEVRDRVIRYRAENASDAALAFRSMFEKHGSLTDGQHSKPFDIGKAANDRVHDANLSVAM